MEVKYKVFSAAEQKVGMVVDIPGVGPSQVEIPGVVVQLIPATGDNGTVKLQFVGDAIDGALELFAPGADITATFTGE